MDFCPLLIAPAFLRLDTVLNINEQTNAAAICAGSFRSAGAFALYAFPYAENAILRKSVIGFYDYVNNSSIGEKHEKLPAIHIPDHQSQYVHYNLFLQSPIL